MAFLACRSPVERTQTGLAWSSQVELPNKRIRFVIRYILLKLCLIYITILYYFIYLYTAFTFGRRQAVSVQGSACRTSKDVAFSCCKHPPLGVDFMLRLYYTLTPCALLSSHPGSDYDIFSATKWTGYRILPVAFTFDQPQPFQDLLLQMLCKSPANRGAVDSSGLRSSPATAATCCGSGIASSNDSRRPTQKLKSLTYNIWRKRIFKPWMISFWASFGEGIDSCLRWQDAPNSAACP